MTDIVGLQLYTVRDETAKDFKATIRRVAEIGYAGVEFAGYGELSSKEMHTLLSENGLQALGSHVGLPALTSNFNQEADYCLEIECPFLVVPWLEPGLRNGAGFSKLAETLNGLGQKSKERGLTLVYHNHDFEFQKNGSSTLLDTLLQSTDAELVKLELDTYWAAYAGVDPVEIIQKYSGRVATLHLKDMTVERTFTEIGDGTLDIASYTEAAQASGTRFFIVENDKPAIPSLESAQRSYENMHRSLT